MLKLVLEIPRLPCHALNTALHLTASIILNNSSSVEANWDLVGVVTKRWEGSEAGVEEVEVVLTVYQELLTSQGDAFIQVCARVCMCVSRTYHLRCAACTLAHSVEDRT